MGVGTNGVKWLVTLGVAALLDACGSSPPLQFFTLSPVKAQRPPSQAASATPVQVAAVRVPPALDRREIVRQTGPNQLEVSGQNRWGEPFPDMARRVLTQNLEERLSKDRVALPRDPAPPGTRQIVLDILQFESDASGTVLFDGGWSLWKAGSNMPILSRRVRLTERANPRDYGDQARAMSVILGRLADGIVDALALPDAQAAAPSAR